MRRPRMVGQSVTRNLLLNRQADLSGLRRRVPGAPALHDLAVPDDEPFHGDQFVGPAGGFVSHEAPLEHASFGVTRDDAIAFGDKFLDGEFDAETVDQLSPDGSRLVDHVRAQHTLHFGIRGEQSLERFEVATIEGDMTERFPCSASG